MIRASPNKKTGTASVFHVQFFLLHNNGNGNKNIGTFRVVVEATILSVLVIKIN